MLKIKDSVNLKDLEKYGFEKINNDIRGHLYRWSENKRNWGYEIYINKNKYIRIKVISVYGGSYYLFANKLQTKLYDLIADGLVEKVDE